MRTRHLTRLAAPFAAALVLLLLAVPSALGKEGVSVDLLAPLPRDAQPGTKVAAFFTMEAISDDVAFPLSGAFAFIRLYGPSGAVTEAAGVEQKTAGTYKAMIEIPAGGVARAEFGIHGQARTPAGRVVATDPVWPYQGLLLTAVVPPPVDPKAFQITGSKPPADPVAPLPAPAGAAVGSTPATSSTPSAGLTIDGRLVAGAGALLLIALAGATIARARRRRPHRQPI